MIRGLSRSHSWVLLNNTARVSIMLSPLTRACIYRDTGVNSPCNGRVPPVTRVCIPRDMGVYPLCDTDDTGL